VVKLAVVEILAGKFGSKLILSVIHSSKETAHE
jgi:hypothetical protein